MKLNEQVLYQYLAKHPQYCWHFILTIRFADEEQDMRIIVEQI